MTTIPSPTLIRITRFGLVNAYLVREDDGLTLVDTAVPRSAKAVQKAAQRLDAPIVRIALTHAHGDHIGSLDALHAALPEAEVLISGRDARLLAKDRTPEPGEPEDAKLRGGYPGATTQPTSLLAHGDRVGSLEVVASPGHTPGHVAYLDTRDGTLIAGDALTTLGGLAPARDSTRGSRPPCSPGTVRPRCRPARAARARAQAPRRRARPDRRRSCPEDGGRDRSGAEVDLDRVRRDLAQQEQVRSELLHRRRLTAGLSADR